MGEQAGRKVRCAVIGAGWWGTYAHIPALLEHPDADLVAIQTSGSEEALRIAKDFRIPRGYGSYQELLAAERLDAVVISSSPHLHYEQARAALEKGLHVLVEKPMTFTAAQARELVLLAEQVGKQLLISAPWHYTRHGREARRLIISGEIGEVRLISILMTNPVAHLIRGANTEPTHAQEVPYIRPRRETYSKPEIAGGGQSYAQVSHAAAYLSFLTGARPARVFARFQNDGCRLDIYDAFNIELENGCLVSLASTGATPRDARNFDVWVFGTEGILYLELWQGLMRWAPLNGDAPKNFPRLKPEELYPERAPARNLVECARNPEANGSPGSLGLAAMEIIESACISAQSGMDVKIRPTRGS
jgi:predicted dehydrogenase